MARNPRTKAIVDGILRVSVATGTITASLLFPGLIQVLDKPVSDYLKNSIKRRGSERLTGS